MRSRLLLAGLLALLLLAAAPALALAQGKPDPTELWEEFPLDPSPTAEKTVAAAQPRERVRVIARDEGPGTFAIVSLMLLAAGIGATAVSLARGRARARRREEPAAKQQVAASPATKLQSASAADRQPAKPPAAAPRRVKKRPRAKPPAPPAPPAPRRAEKPPPAKQPPAPAAPRRAEKPPPAKPPAPRRDKQSRPRADQPAKPPARAPTEAAPEPTAPGWLSCRVRLWEGYIKKQFYAEVPGGTWVAQSPFFRVEKGHTIDDSKQAEEAFEALVEELVAGGWEITGRRRGWHLSLRRRTGAARPATRQPVE